MKNIAFLALILSISLAMFAGCSRGDVAEHGVDAKNEMRRSSGENDLYEDESLFMEETEEGAEHLREETQNGIDRAQETVEEGMENFMDGMHENNGTMAQSDKKNQ